MTQDKKSYLIPYQILQEYLQTIYSGEKTMSIQLLVQIYAEMSDNKLVDEKVLVQDFINELNWYLNELLEGKK